MTPPPSKKQKTMADPLVFKWHDTPPDTRIKVFDKEFHVQSSILRVHSRFFLKFLDSAEKPAVSATPAPFRYGYISVVEKDGKLWGLEPASMADISAAKHMEESTKKTEEALFEKLLCAMYNKDYCIGGISELEELTRIADFYRALPILSSSLYKVLWKSPQVMIDTFVYQFRSLSVARKLRHPLLFREALIHVVGDFSSWDAFTSKLPRDDEVLKNFIIKTQLRLCTIKMKADFLIFSACFDNSRVQEVIEDLNRPAGVLRGARFYRSLRMRMIKIQIFHPKDDLLEAVKALDALLKSNLVLDSLRIAGQTLGTNSGNLDNSDLFYCAEISDDEIPWDATETDW